MLNDGLFRAKSTQHVLRAKQDTHQWNEDECIDESSAVQVNSAKNVLLCTVSLRYERIQSAIHPHDNRQPERQKQLGPKADSRQFRIVI